MHKIWWKKGSNTRRRKSISGWRAHLCGSWATSAVFWPLLSSQWEGKTHWTGTMRHTGRTWLTWKLSGHWLWRHKCEHWKKQRKYMINIALMIQNGPDSFPVQFQKRHPGPVHHARWVTMGSTLLRLKQRALLYLWKDLLDLCSTYTFPASSRSRLSSTWLKVQETSTFL